MFELADNWTATTDAAEYTAFLYDLMLRIFAADWSSDTDAAFQITMKKVPAHHFACANFLGWQAQHRQKRENFAQRFLSSIEAEDMALASTLVKQRPPGQEDDLANCTKEEGSNKGTNKAQLYGEGSSTDTTNNLANTTCAGSDPNAEQQQQPQRQAKLRKDGESTTTSSFKTYRSIKSPFCACLPSCSMLLIEYEGGNCIAPLLPVSSISIGSPTTSKIFFFFFLNSQRAL